MSNNEHNIKIFLIRGSSRGYSHVAKGKDKRSTSFASVRRTRGGHRVSRAWPDRSRRTTAGQLEDDTRIEGSGARLETVVSFLRENPNSKRFGEL